MRLLQSDTQKSRSFIPIPRCLPSSLLTTTVRTLTKPHRRHTMHGLRARGDPNTAPCCIFLPRWPKRTVHTQCHCQNIARCNCVCVCGRANIECICSLCALLVSFLRTQGGGGADAAPKAAAPGEKIITSVSWLFHGPGDTAQLNVWTLSPKDKFTFAIHTTAPNMKK